MRAWFLVLMIALLPLRGWMGDAMAIEMLATPAHAAVVIGDHGAHHAHEDCKAQTSVEHAGLATGGFAHAGLEHQGQQHGDTDHSSGGHQHNACDVCNVPALATAGSELQSLPDVHGQLSLPTERFASSEAQRGIKPPIS